VLWEAEAESAVVRRSNGSNPERRESLSGVRQPLLGTADSEDLDNGKDGNTSPTDALEDRLIATPSRPANVAGRGGRMSSEDADGYGSPGAVAVGGMSMGLGVSIPALAPITALAPTNDPLNDYFGDAHPHSADSASPVRQRDSPYQRHPGDAGHSVWTNSPPFARNHHVNTRTGAGV
jgi:hypothetical protein